MNIKFFFMDNSQKIFLIKNIEKIGKYCYLNYSSTVMNLDKKIIDDAFNDDWWAALKFFFYHAFMRGRRDELSEKYFNKAIKVFEEFGLNQSVLKIHNILNSGLLEYVNNFKPGIKGRSEEKALTKFIDYMYSGPSSHNNDSLMELLKNISNNEKFDGITNYKDLIMIVNVLDFISSNDEHKNIVKYACSYFPDNVHNVYDKLNDIKFIGPKISSFFLRNISHFGNLEINPEPKSLACLLPFDTWITQVCLKVGIIDENIYPFFINNKDERDRINHVVMYPQKAMEAMANYCRSNDIDAVFFNQGCWYLGFNSFNIAIDQLSIHEFVS